MKKILRFKFKLHSLVNYIFYLFIFIIGFILGKIGSFTNLKDLIINFRK